MYYYWQRHISRRLATINVTRTESTEVARAAMSQMFRRYRHHNERNREDHLKSIHFLNSVFHGLHLTQFVDTFSWRYSHNVPNTVSKMNTLYMFCQVLWSSGLQLGAIRMVNAITICILPSKCLRRNDTSNWTASSGWANEFWKWLWIRFQWSLGLPLHTVGRRAVPRDEHSTELSAKLAYGDNGILSGVMAGGTPIWL